MSLEIPDFWRLILQSRLLSPQECEKLGEEFGHVKGAATQGNARTLAEWLISRNVITRYQAKVLLSGRPGPFVYGQYKITERMPKGPFAGMYRAVHQGSRHPCILYFLTGPATQNPNQWGTLLKRATRFFAVVHPHLLRSYELVDLTGYKFLVLEGLEGDPLARFLSASGGRLNLPEACRVVRQAALGLSRLHELELVRGDVRPESIWMERGGNVKLPHIPLSSPVPVDIHGIDPDGAKAALADYLAPELAQSGRKPDSLTDIYGLGCTLYHLVAGEPPFTGGDAAGKMIRHATEAIRPLDQIVGAPQPLAQITAYMMAKNPTVRYQRAQDVAEALAAFVDHSQSIPVPSMQAPTLPAYEAYVAEQQVLQSQQASAAPEVKATPKFNQPIPISRVASAQDDPSLAEALPTSASGEIPADAIPGGGTGDRAEESLAQGASKKTTRGAAGSQDDTSPSPSKWLTPRNAILAAAGLLVVVFVLATASCFACGSPAPGVENGRTARPCSTPGESVPYTKTTQKKTRVGARRFSPDRFRGPRTLFSISSAGPAAVALFPAPGGPRCFSSRLRRRTGCRG